MGQIRQLFTNFSDISPFLDLFVSVFWIIYKDIIM